MSGSSTSSPGARRTGRRVDTVRGVRREPLAAAAPDPAEYADVAVFLLSDLSRSITGHVLDANGGEYFD